MTVFDITTDPGPYPQPWGLLDDDAQTIDDGDTTTQPQARITAFKMYETAGAGGAGALNNVVEDTTPQLGGSLDVNGNKIVSVSDGNIDIEPNGTGDVLLGNLTFDADQTVGAGQDDYVLTYDNAAGTIGLEASAGGGGGGALQFTELLDQTFSGQSSVDVDCTGYDQVQLIWDDIDFSTTAGMRVRVSTDGVTFDSGAADYRSLEMTDTNNSAGDGAFLNISVKAATQTENYGSAMVLNLANGNYRTMSQSFSGVDAGSQLSRRMSYRKTAQVDTHIRVMPNTGNFTSGRLRVLGVGTAKSLSASTPDANIQGVVNQIDVITMSSMTANRDYLLPTTAAVGQIAGISIVDGDPDHEILIKSGAAGDKINNVDHSTNEFTRLFIAGERMVFECIDAAGPHWQVKEDGRIPCVVDAYLSTDADGEGAAAWTAPTAAGGVWTETKDNASLFNASTSQFTTRRNGDYQVSMTYRNKDVLADGGNFGIRFQDGTTTIQSLDRAAAASVSKNLGLARLINMSDGVVFTFEYFSSAGGIGLSSASRFTSISIAEQL